MKDNLIILGSVTYAMKSKDILMRHGINSYIQRSKKTKEFGCGYGVYIPTGAEKAEHILRENGIRILAITYKE